MQNAELRVPCTAIQIVYGKLSAELSLPRKREGDRFSGGGSAKQISGARFQITEVTTSIIHYSLANRLHYSLNMIAALPLFYAPLSLLSSRCACHFPHPREAVKAESCSAVSASLGRGRGTALAVVGVPNRFQVQDFRLLKLPPQLFIIH